MADPIKVKFDVDAERAKREVREMKQELGGVEGATDKAGGGMASFAGKAAIATAALAAAAAAVNKLLDGIVAFGEELERQAGIMNRFTGDISEARDRMNGLVTDLDLMVAQSKIAQAGLQATAHDFANITVAANEFASRVGGDATAAINQLAQALATGRTGALLQYGINLEGITSIADKQREALRQLNERYGNQESSADTLGGQLTVLQNTLDNIETAFLDGINTADDLTRSFNELGAELEGLAGIFNTSLPSAMDFAKRVAAGFAAEMSVTIAAMTDGVRALAEVIRGDLGAAWQHAQRAATRRSEVMARFRENLESMDQAARERFVAGLVEQGTGAARRGNRAAGEAARRGRGRGRRRETAEAPTGGGFTLDDFAREEAGIEGDLAHEERLARRAEEQRNFDKERITAQAEYNRLQEQEREAIAKQNEERARAEEQQRAMNAAIQREHQLRNDMIGAASQWGSTLLKEVGASQGQIEIWNAVSEGAKAISTAFTNPLEAASHAIAAGVHIKNAADMGVGGAPAAPAAPGGGAGGRAPVRPDGARGAGTGGGGGIGTLNVTYNAPTDPAMIGRLQRANERAANRRFGRAP